MGTLGPPRTLVNLLLHGNYTLNVLEIQGCQQLARKDFIHAEKEQKHAS